MSVEQAITEEVIVMISDESRRKLRELSLEAFIEALDHQELHVSEYASMPFDQRLDLVIDDCYTRKNNDRAKRLLRYAKLRYPDADIHSLYYDGRDLDKNQILLLATGSFIEVPRNIVINGFTGTGKTYLACAFGKEACRHLHRSRYIRMPDLLEMFNLSEQTGRSISSTVTKLANYHVLIVDEWLLDIPSEREIKYLLEVFEKRYDQWPTIFCTQYKISEWHPRLGGGVIADAILDRIVHNSEIISLGSKNMREFYSSKSLTL